MAEPGDDPVPLGLVLGPDEALRVLEALEEALLPASLDDFEVLAS